MKKLIAIVAGEPNSINSEIIAKAWKSKSTKKNLFIIGNYELFKKQINKIGIKIKTQKIDSIAKIKNKKYLYILDVPLKYKSLFKCSVADTKKYVFQSLNIAHKLAVNKLIKAFINAPVDKKIFNNKYLGVTEYLSSKNKKKIRKLC